jgi:hypothetical protein
METAYSMMELQKRCPSRISRRVEHLAHGWSRRVGERTVRNAVLGKYDLLRFDRSQDKNALRRTTSTQEPLLRSQKSKMCYYPREASSFWGEVVISKGDGLGYQPSN